MKLSVNDNLDFSEIFCRRIVEARKTLGLSQEALASSFGVSRTTIQNWEKGGGVEFGRLGEIAAVLGKPVAWFFTPDTSLEDTPTTVAGAVRQLREAEALVAKAREDLERLLGGTTERSEG